MLNVLLNGSTAKRSKKWRARCRHSLYVGEFEAVFLNVLGTAQVLLLDVDMRFAIPADIGRARWGQLSRGDLICVRWNGDGVTHMPVALAVDAIDGRISIASNRITELGICETQNRRSGRPRKSTEWRLYGLGLPSIATRTFAAFLRIAERQPRKL